MMAVDATTALGYLDAGIAVVPPREDGTKRPDGTWRQYEHEPPHRQPQASPGALAVPLRPVQRPHRAGDDRCGCQFRFHGHQ